MLTPFTLPLRLLWRAQDAVRRRINRLWYCSLGEHRRDRPDAPCKDCGDPGAAGD